MNLGGRLTYPLWVLAFGMLGAALTGVSISALFVNDDAVVGTVGIILGVAMWTSAIALRFYLRTVEQLDEARAG